MSRAALATRSAVSGVLAVALRPGFLLYHVYPAKPAPSSAAWPASAARKAIRRSAAASRLHKRRAAEDELTISKFFFEARAVKREL